MSRRGGIPGEEEQGRRNGEGPGQDPVADQRQRKLLRPAGGRRIDQFRTRRVYQTHAPEVRSLGLELELELKGARSHPGRQAQEERAKARGGILTEGEECLHAGQEGLCTRGPVWKEEKCGFAGDAAVRAGARRVEKAEEILRRKDVRLGRGRCLRGQLE